MKRFVIFIFCAVLFVVGCTDNTTKKDNGLEISKSATRGPKSTRLKPPNAPDRSFDEFFKKFNTDPAYQKAHIKFPLKIEIEDMDSDTIKYLQADAWVNVKLINNGKTIIKKERINDKEVNIIFMIEDTGEHVNHYFKYNNGEWRLQWVKNDGD